LSIQDIKNIYVLMQESKIKTGGRQISNCFVGSMPTSARFYSILTPQRRTLGENLRYKLAVRRKGARPIEAAIYRTTSQTAAIFTGR
jgi:hypothetical protein